MTSRGLTPGLFAMTLFIVACSGVQRLDGPPLGERLANALERALEAGWEELYILEECHLRDSWTTVEIFGNGVGIWNGTTQFELTPEQIREQLRAFVEADFASLSELYGGNPSGAAAIRITCRVRLEIDGASKQVAQRFKGDQSAELRRLAERIAEICEAPAREGVVVADLDDGLVKIAAGELAVETLRLVVHRKPRDPVAAPGWLLRLEGPRASTRALSAERGYEEPVYLELTTAELTELARLLAEGQVGSLPANLYAEHYTDVLVKVLGFDKSVQARQFAGMTPTRHGEEQERFERVFEGLEALHRLVVSRGRREASGD